MSLPAISPGKITLPAELLLQTTSKRAQSLPSLPSIDNYWNPGPATVRELCKLQLLHGVSLSGGILSRCLGRLAKNTVGILTYHRIAPRIRGVESPTINVTPDSFRRQLTGLQRLGFQFASLRAVLDVLKTGAAVRERTVVLTFDDIYDNVFLNAFPVLQELKIPFTAFISTAFVDSKDPFLFDPWAMSFRHRIPTQTWLPVSSDHLKAMLDSGLAALGAHTHTHQDFRERPEDFGADLAEGIDQLHRMFDTVNPPFAFPFGIPRMGFCDSSLMDVVCSSALSCGLTTGAHTNHQRSSAYGWGRFHVFEHDTPLSLAGKLDGWYEWLPRLKNRFASNRSGNSRQELPHERV